MEMSLRGAKPGAPAAVLHTATAAAETPQFMPAAPIHNRLGSGTWQGGGALDAFFDWVQREQLVGEITFEVKQQVMLPELAMSE